MALPLRPEGSLAGTYGDAEVTCRLWRMTWDNRLVEELATHVVAGSVTCDPGRDSTWRLDCTLLAEGWRQLRPYRDWVAPFLRVRMPDGVVRSAQLGLYLVLDSAEDHAEEGYTVRLDARDPLWLLSRQGFSAKVVARAGVDVGTFVRGIVADAVLTEDRQGKARYTIPALGKSFRKDREWPAESLRLAVANEALTGKNAYPLWTERTGLITTRSRSSRLRERNPVRAWFANVPARNAVEPPVPAELLVYRGEPSEVVASVPTTPRSADLVNEVVVVNDFGGADGRSRIFERHRIGNPANRRSFLATTTERLSTGRRIANPTIETADEAKAVAAALADELSTKNTTLSLSVVPDPAADLIREVVLLGVWDADGAEVARGRYWVRSVRYGLTAADPLMRLELGRVEDSDDFA